jgi:hypothetical protein
MKFEQLVKSLLEGFNVYPQNQTAPSTGPDAGMTSGDMQNTFPSKMETVQFKIKRKKIKKKLKKD